MPSFRAPKTILVTGPAGFIGSNFVRQFRARFPKTRIIGIDNFSTGRRDAIHPDLILYKGSITDIQLLDRLFRKHKPEYIFHFAALPRVSYSVEHPTETTIANIVGTVALLEKAREYTVKRVIYSSSSSVYGGAKILPTREDENPPQPVSPYGLQKYTGEPFCKMFSDLFGVDTVSLRYFNVFGPGQYGSSPYSTVVSAWLEGLYFPKKKKIFIPLEIVPCRSVARVTDRNKLRRGLHALAFLTGFIEGDGRQSRDFCYVDNVVEANIRAMQARGPLCGAALNIANGERTNLLTVKRLIEKYTGHTLKLARLKPRVGDVRHTHADISKAHRLIGYKPSVGFREGIERTIAWFEKRTR